MTNTRADNYYNEKKDVLLILEKIYDPEIPVLTITEMGIVRDIRFHSDNSLEIVITPTYSGCPAMDVITFQIREALISAGYSDVKITQQLSPAWTTDEISESGKQKLKAYGIAPPDRRFSPPADGVECPLCHSANTKLISEFGSTACKALFQCLDCKEPFDYFKCH
ncbi:MAG: phenylacetate-CoA oxygenase subunit PaaJ [Chitinophagaceae bacterium]|nr:phenylacetate-CoA oxygenase subunit PaaJ [Chitinophagaceae bacterium]